MDETSDVLQFPLERGQDSFVHHRLKQRSPLCYLYLIMKLDQITKQFKLEFVERKKPLSNYEIISNK